MNSDETVTAVTKLASPPSLRMQEALTYGSACFGDP
jgi:hypothetical protein